MKSALFSAAAVGLAAGFASAQSIEYRIVERQNRGIVTGAADADLNFAIQGRVVGGSPVTGILYCGFDIRIVGEPEVNGTLARCVISNPDHTYTDVIALGAIVGRAGLASQFSYLASISANQNGLINASGGPFTNTPDQDIGGVFGSSIGPTLISTPGLDADEDSNPDTWSGNGSGTPPPNGSTATVPPAVASAYFGAAGNWVDIYRFRYTVTNFTPRGLTIHLGAVNGKVFDGSLIFQNGLWGATSIVPTSISAPDLSVLVSGTGTGVCCTTQGGCTVSTGAACSGFFLAGNSCDPLPCPQPGACCNATTGACQLIQQTACLNNWLGGTACDPNPCPQPGRCCAATGACLITLQGACAANWSAGGACSPNTCPQPGRCCNPTTGACIAQLQSACTGQFISGSAVCNPNPCPQPSRCCLADGTCSITTALACPGIWSSISSCSPNTCPQPGRCCHNGGECSITVPVDCGGDWLAAATCSPNLCPSLGACCNGSTCTFTDSASCASASGIFGGNASNCGSFHNPVTCCPANFNHTGGLEVVDIFVFLNTWLAANMAADFNHSSTLEQQDIFDFINAWLASCN